MVIRIGEREIHSQAETIISLLFFLPQINYYLSALLSSYNMPTFTVYVYIALMIIGCWAYLQCFARSKKTCVIGVFLMASLIVYSVLVNPETWKYMIGDSIATSPLLFFAFIYYPTFLLLITGIDLKILFYVFSKYSFITLLFSISAFFNYVVMQHRAMPDYMSFAYMMLSPLMLCFENGTRGRPIYLSLAVAATIIILIGGCRGALVTLAIFYLLSFISFFSTKGSLKKGLLKFVIVIGAIIIIANVEVIVSIIESKLIIFGYQSRVLLSLFSQTEGGSTTFTDIGGRSDIWQQAILNIRLYGYGLFGDRTFTINEMGSNVYVHNLFLEILITFGLILGGVILVILLNRMMFAVIRVVKSRNREVSIFTFSMLCVIFVKHMVSGSFASSFDFWVYMGLLLLLSRRKFNIEGNECDRVTLSFYR